MTPDVLTLGTDVVSLIDLVTTSSPDATAVSGPDGTLTYAEMATRAQRIARRLHNVGVQPGDLVGLCVERSVALVVAALSIMKADAVYVAIDPKYPDERIRWMLDDCGAAAVVFDADTADRLGTIGDLPTVVLAGGDDERDLVRTITDDSDTGGTATHDTVDDVLDGRPEPSDLAYVVYTSGSTGQPKGVMVEHGSLANLIDWHCETFGLTSHDRCTQIASPGFDAAVWEIWPCLASGASLHIVPDDLRRDPISLRDWLVAEGITVTFLPTAVAEGLMGLTWPSDGALRYVLTGGDALTRRPPAGLGFSVVNNYGLSETTVVATSATVAPEGADAPSIGRPISGVTVEILDEHLAPVTPGSAGELVIGGIAVGRGYLHRPELTAERFVEDDHGLRYRTGDRVRMRPDGEIEFLGRLDDQLSIRGFRVEPAEIASALSSHTAVRTSVVVGLGATSAQRRLVAYVVAAGTERPSVDDLSGYLGGVLPGHMVPATYVWIDELPLTAHGKIDRQALPAPVDTADNVPADGTDGGQPRTATQTAVAAVLAELLDVAEIGMHQNFFLLGGHSMLGAQLIVRLEKLFDVEITLRFLFDHPTLAEIADEVENQIAASVADGSRLG
jgi:amino acid adenylation domain-containing protein